MNKERPLLLTILVLVALVWVGWLLVRRYQISEPAYQGRRLTFWVEHLGSPGGKEAIRQMGTNGVPTLLRLITLRDNLWRKKLLQLSESGRFVRLRTIIIPDEVYRQNAGSAFMMLGPAAKDAIPDLAKLLDAKDHGIRYHAMRALTGIGTEACLIPLTHACTNDSMQVRLSAVLNLGWEAQVAKQKMPSEWQFFRFHTHEIVSPLIASLRDQDPRVRRGAILSLGSIGLLPDEVVPAIIKQLHDPDFSVRASTADVLGRFGDQAKEASLPLRELLNDSNNEVRLAVTNALEHIETARAIKSGNAPQL